MATVKVLVEFTVPDDMEDASAVCEEAINNGLDILAQEDSDVMSEIDEWGTSIVTD